MKLTFLFASTALTAAALLRRHRPRPSANEMVRIEVKVISAQEHKAAPKAGSKPDPTVTHEKTLEILLSGKPKIPETRTGKWSIYGKSGKDVVAVDSGDFKIELPPSGQQKVESKKVTITFTPEHFEGGGGGKNAKGGKKVEASGTKYVGWGVVVKDGDKTVGEAYDPMGLKAELAK